MKTEIDINRWQRASVYSFFRSVSHPHMSVTADIDITRFMKEVKPRGISTFNSVLFAIMKAVNSIEEFRCRFEGDSIYRYEVTHPSITVPIQENQFAFCEIQFSNNWETFDRNCVEAIEKAKRQESLQENTKSDVWTYLTCAPWIHFSALTHPNNGPDDAIPRIAWGKFTQIGDKWTMPLNVQAHHALLDGYHASQLFLKTEEILRTESFTD